MAKLRLFFELLFPLVQATVRSSSTFNSPHHFGFSSQFLNNSDSGFGFVPSREFQSHLQYPIPNSTPYPAFHVPPNTFTPPLFEQGQLYAGPGPGDAANPSGIYERQYFPQRGFFQPTVSLPLGYFPAHFGGTSTTVPFPGNSPYSLPNSSTPPSTPQIQLAPPGKLNLKHYYSPEIEHYYPRHFPPLPPPPVPPRFQEGFDFGFLPTQVRVPGTIQINFIGKDAEITCEFPKYLILVQGIYWHHKYIHDPFGSYFDTQNGFGGHTTVRSIDKWKSVLLIQDFGVDNHGVYRCISSAAIPAESEKTQQAPPVPQSFVTLPTRATFGHNFKLMPTMAIPTPGSPQPFGLKPPMGSTLPDHMSDDTMSDDGNKKRVSRYTKNSRKMRFPPPLQETKNRVKRQQSTTASSEDDKQLLEESRRFFSLFPSTPYGYSDPAFNYNRLTNPYVDLFQQQKTLEKEIHQQQDRHLPYPWGYPGFGLQFFPPIAPPVPQPYPTPGYGLNIPYYKPTISYTTIYQEIKFEPDGGAGGSSTNRGWRRI